MPVVTETPREIRRRNAQLLDAAAREMGEIGAGVRRPARSVSRRDGDFYEAWMETGEALTAGCRGNDSDPVDENGG